MSGIEVAGLVLGAFPILIRALESYREGAEFLGDWWRIQRAYTKCRQDLQYHQVLFEGNVERFLLPLVVDDEELKNLMSDPAGEAWRDEELEARLKERLPKSYRIFLDTMGNINDLMEDLKKELGVYNRLFGESARPAQGSSGTDVKRNDLLSISNFEFQTKRIKFSLKRSSRERLFVQFQHANDRMRSLLENSDQIAIARRDREPGKNASVMGRKLNDFWRHAKRLHDALSSAWQCSCVDHQTTLQLQHRTSDKPEFDVVFNLGARCSGQFPENGM
ncbi:hypothetical protein M011DRAFT_496157 [Sporormia fimetaria CBS 119925]|uniref:Prion-inhibition and propagation HeLo domain-containing protein n=1 Tax=Sporormia fimetaria CBS 119925 TaxID=1340428 RepID=A0A6A6V3P7_9PLEO|nr:hypothetical protein M011DRAFT_496157 [Sporormia fimetaria CBS 119925]